MGQYSALLCGVNAVPSIETKFLAVNVVDAWAKMHPQVGNS